MARQMLLQLDNRQLASAPNRIVIPTAPPKLLLQNSHPPFVCQGGLGKGEHEQVLDVASSYPRVKFAYLVFQPTHFNVCWILELTAYTPLS